MNPSGDVQNRIKPGYGNALLLVILGLFFILLISCLTCGLRSPNEGWRALILPTMGICIFLYVSFAGMRKWRQTYLYTHDSITTTGTIFDRQTKVERGYDQNYTVYDICVKFSTATGEVHLKSRVDHALYQKSLISSKIGVQYARENPRVALFEGEH